MKCKQCCAEAENSRCCPYCGSENVNYDAVADAIQQDKARQNIPGQGRGREAYDSGKSKMVTSLLAPFSGPLGLHNFYIGRRGRALFCMITMGFLIFGWFYDLFMIATNKFKDANGDYIVRQEDALMGFSDLLMGQFIDVIENDKDISHLIALKYQRNGRDNEVKQGARLVVRESQAVVFMSEGGLVDAFSAGPYTLNMENMPILSTLQSWKYGFRLPITSDLFFVNLKALAGNKWETGNPFIIEDPTFSVVRARGFGTFSLRVVDAEKFMRELVGAQMIYQTDDVIESVRLIVIESLIDVIAEEKIRVAELASKLREISEAARDNANEKIETMGISLLMINIENISLPEEAEEFIGEQPGTNLVSGNIQNFQQWQQSRAMRNAAQQSQGIVGIGVGFAFVQQMNTMTAQPQEPAVKEVIRIKCPNCRELNKEDVKFCYECRTSLITKKYHPQCGGEVETDSKLCSTCGQKLQTKKTLTEVQRRIIEEKECFSCLAA